MSVFAKGQTHDFPQKFESFFASYFFQKRPKNDVE